MENFFKKSIKKLATGAAFVGALAGSPEKADGQVIGVEKDKTKEKIEVPAYHTTDPNDPRLKAYKDSLYMYNRNLKYNAFIGGKELKEAKKQDSEFFIENVPIRNLGESDQRIKDYIKNDPIKPIGAKMYGRVSRNFFGRGDEEKKQELLNYGLPSSKAWSGGFDVEGLGYQDENTKNDAKISDWDIHPGNFDDATRGHIVLQYKKPSQKVILDKILQEKKIQEPLNKSIKPKKIEETKKIEKLEQKITEQLTPQKKEEVKFPKGPLKYATVDKAGQKYFFMTDSVGGTVRSVTERAYQNDYKDLPEVKYEDLKRAQEGK